MLDAASPAMAGTVPEGPKLVRVDLADGRIDRIVRFDEKIAPKASYLNDVRFAANGAHAYITDSGKGALIVVDLATGKSRRVLDGHYSTQMEKDVIPRADGAELRRPDGRTLEAQADGLALSADGEALYWQALTGRILYRVPTMLLDHPPTRAGALERSVEAVGVNGVADGLWIDRKNRMYVTAPEYDGIALRRDLNHRYANAVPYIQDDRLRWPDSMAEGPDGTLYVTASHIQDSPWFKPGADKAVKSELFSFNPAE